MPEIAHLISVIVPVRVVHDCHNDYELVTVTAAKKLITSAGFLGL